MTSGYYTTTQSETFTVTDAQHIAAKVATDLKRMQRFYEKPSDGEIDDYEKEAIALLRGDYLDTVTYGFHRDGNWIVALRYAARHGVLIVDDPPGRVPMRGHVLDCVFNSVLQGNKKWHSLTENEKTRIYREAGVVSLRRVPGNDYNGEWHTDRTYSAGGRGVVRCVLR